MPFPPLCRFSTADLIHAIGPIYAPSLAAMPSRRRTSSSVWPRPTVKQLLLACCCCCAVFNVSKPKAFPGGASRGVGRRHGRWRVKAGLELPALAATGQGANVWDKCRPGETWSCLTRRADPWRDFHAGPHPLGFGFEHKLYNMHLACTKALT